MTENHVDWNTIRTLCEEAGIGREFQDYEDSLPSLIVGAMVGGTNTSYRYLHDAEFHHMVDLLTLMIVAALTQTKTRQPQTVDIEGLSKIFLEEVEETRK